MDRRLDLQMKLEEIPGVKRAYFQPPSSVMMEYPCVRYARSKARLLRADNQAYRFTQGYELMVIDPDPDSQIPKYIVDFFPMAEINSVYISENLYHTSITLYY